MLPASFKGQIGAWERGQGKIFASGSIQGIYKSSFNLVFPSGMIHVGSLKKPLCCFGIGVEEGELRKILDSCCENHQAFLKKDGLWIYGKNQQFCLKLDDFIQKDLQIPIINVKEKNLYEDVQMLLECMDLKSHAGLDTESEKFKTCCEGLIKGNRTELKQAVLYLVGRGMGLTPSGDDILLGYTGLLKAAGLHRQVEEILISHVSGNTTEVSLNYYKALFLGYINWDFKKLLECLGHKEAAKPYIESIKSLGHTSGWDTLLGLLIGLKKMGKM